MTKIPEAMKRGMNMPLHEAIAARAPPIAKDPVFPIVTDAR